MLKPNFKITKIPQVNTTVYLGVFAYAMLLKITKKDIALIKSF